MKFQAGKGHLHCGSLHLMQTEEMHQRIEKVRKANLTVEKLPPVSLDWKRGSDSKKPQRKEAEKMQNGKRQKTSISNLVQDHLAMPSYNPAALLDMLLEVMQVETDYELAKSLCLARSVICRLRRRTAPLSAGVLLRMHDVSGLTIENLRDLAGIPTPEFL